MKSDWPRGIRYTSFLEFKVPKRGAYMQNIYWTGPSKPRNNPFFAWSMITPYFQNMYLLVGDIRIHYEGGYPPERSSRAV